LPKGRIVEIYGPESSGKTTLTLHAIAEVQKQGGVAAFIDADTASTDRAISHARAEDRTGTSRLTRRIVSASVSNSPSTKANPTSR